VFAWTFSASEVLVIALVATGVAVGLVVRARCLK
jgi:hypothetical protein